MPSFTSASRSKSSDPLHFYNHIRSKEQRLTRIPWNYLSVAPSTSNCHSFVTLLPETPTPEDPMPIRPVALLTVIAVFALGCAKVDDSKPQPSGSGAPPTVDKATISIKGSDT